MRLTLQYHAGENRAAPQLRRQQPVFIIQYNISREEEYMRAQFQNWERICRATLQSRHSGQKRIQKISVVSNLGRSYPLLRNRECSRKCLRSCTSSLRAYCGSCTGPSHPGFVACRHTLDLTYPVENPSYLVGRWVGRWACGAVVIQRVLHGFVVGLWETFGILYRSTYGMSDLHKYSDQWNKTGFFDACARHSSHRL